MTRAFPRRGLPLLLLAAAFAALAVLVVGGARPASAQQPGDAVWSATLEVRTLGIGVAVGCHDGLPGERCEPGGGLTDDDFRFRGTDYEIDELQLNVLLNKEKLGLTFNRHVSPEHRALLTLRIAERAFPLADASWSSSDPNHAPDKRDSAVWRGTDMWWSVSQLLPVSLTYDPPVWWATLTVAAEAIGGLTTALGCDDNAPNNRRHCEPEAALSDDEFRYLGRDYEINRLNDFRLADQLEFETARHLSPEARARLTLHLGGKAFPLATAPNPTTSDPEGAPDQRNLFGWQTPGLNWSDGDEVLVRLTDDAQSETLLWSATLTVQETGNTASGCNSGAIRGQMPVAVACSAEPGGPLSDDDFHYGGTTYEVIRLHYYSVTTTTLDFMVDKHLPAHVREWGTLRLGDREFSLGDAVWTTSWPGAPDRRNLATWNVPSSTWSVGDTVEVSLTLPPPPSLIRMTADLGAPCEGDHVKLTATLDQPAGKYGQIVTLTPGGTATHRSNGGWDGAIARTRGDWQIDGFSHGTGLGNYKSFTIPEGETSHEATLTVYRDDVADPGETLTVKAAGGGLSGHRLQSDPLTLTIRDGACSPRQVVLSVSQQTVTEDAGTVTVTATADPPPTRSDLSVSIAARSTGSDATATDDYTGLPATITIRQGQTTGTATITIVDDAAAEPHEIIVIRGSTAAIPGSRPSGISVRETWVTIKKSDGGGSAGVTIAPTTLALGGTYLDTATYTVKLDTPPTANVSITSATNSPGLFIWHPATLTFTPTNWATPQTVTVTRSNPGSATIYFSGPSSNEASYRGTFASVTVSDGSQSTAREPDRIRIPQQQQADGGTAPANVQVTPGDGALTVSWTVTPRDGAADGEISHALRWSQQSGVWANPTDPYAGGPEDGVALEGGVYSYTITGLENGVATGVFVRSFTGGSHSERSEHSSQWVRLKGAHTTPVAGQQEPETPNRAPTVSSALGDVTIVNNTASGMREVSLSGVFSDADGDDLSFSAASSDETVALVWIASDQFDLLVILGNSRGTATVTVTADDGNGGTAKDTFTVTVKAAPVVASALADVSGLQAGAEQTVLLPGVFSDADGDALSISAASSNTAAATVSVTSDYGKLTVTSVAAGTATITVTAQDADGNRVSDAFQVLVVAAAPPQDPEPQQQQEPEQTPQEPQGDIGPEPANVQVVPGDGTLTVSWTVASRDGVEDGEIRHALRWSQQSGVWANPTDRRAGGPEDGITLEGGVYRYTITGLENGTATGVFVRSFTGSSYSERSVHSSQWLRVKGEHTTPRAE